MRFFHWLGSWWTPPDLEPRESVAAFRVFMAAASYDVQFGGDVKAAIVKYASYEPPEPRGPFYREGA